MVAPYELVSRFLVCADMSLDSKVSGTPNKTWTSWKNFSRAMIQPYVKLQVHHLNGTATLNCGRSTYQDSKQ